ncbi:MAG: PstS family phosphate ABC transporter substrate-binding protein [Nitrospinaceae bacterium]
MQEKLSTGLIAGFLFLSLGSMVTAGPIALDPNLQSYKKTSGISGNLNSIGSDTLNNLMTYWAEKFREFYPNVNVQIEGKGSSTAPPALIEATAQLGPMSRQMKAREIDAFEKKFGYKPTRVRVAIDALALFVNKNNPIKGLNLAQVDAAFSKTRKLGGPKAATWGDLGLTGDWAHRPLSLYGRNSASGTYGYFKKVALNKGDYKDEVKEQPGSASVVLGVSVDRFGLGYSGIGYRTSGVRVLPLAESGTEYFAPTQENAMTGDYPLARFLYIYINKAPGKPVDPLTREFLKMVFSKQGQRVVVKSGYFPLPASLVREDLAQITGGGA